MNRNYFKQPDGYRETIERGITGVQTFRGGLTEGTLPRQEALARLKTEIETADAIVIGAGAGLSTSAGFIYSGERFHSYFSDFEAHFGIRDMYSGGFYPFPDAETRWAFWARNIYVNRYMDPPGSVYQDLYSLVKDKDYFVITTNVDHCFQKAGFDKERLFYTQGDYGLWQCSKPCHGKTYDNEEQVRQMLQAQGFSFAEDGALEPPAGKALQMRIPSGLVPHCPVCGRPMTMNLRSDDRFVEDEGWHRATERYTAFLRRNLDRKTLFLECCVGYNTPGIIKYSFWQQVYQNENAVYACLNLTEEPVPKEIKEQSIVISGDSARVIGELIS